MEEAAMLGSFIRLVDYMLVEALVDRTIGTVEELVAMLEAPRTSTDKTHKVCYTLVQAMALVTPCVVSGHTSFAQQSPQIACVTCESLHWLHVVWLSEPFAFFAGCVFDNSVLC